MTLVLFACVHNAGRSQMAQALFNAAADPARARAVSAGTRPADRVHPEVAAVLAERGLAAATSAPRRLTSDLAAAAQWLITMGCGDECPVVPGARREDWPIADPRGRGAAEVRAICAEIDARVQSLIDREGWR
jgi:arsenate reductase